MLLPRVLERACQRNEGNPGSTVNGQQNRVGYVLAAHFDPLIDAADSYRLKTVDAMGRTNSPRFSNLVLQIFSVGEARREHHNNQAHHTYADIFYDPGDA